MERNGFTPFELVAVIIVIVILAAVAVPHIISLREDARRAVCQSDVSAIRTAIANWNARYRINNNTCPGGPGACSAEGYPLAGQLKDRGSHFATQYFPEGMLPNAADITSKTGRSWAEHYNETTGAINMTSCCE